MQCRVVNATHNSPRTDEKKQREKEPVKTKKA